MSRSDFLVTADIPETLEGRYRVDLGDYREELEEIQERYLNRFEEVVPEDVSYQVVEGGEIEEWLNSEINQAADPVVTIDDIYSEEAEELINATRLTDPNTGETRLGSRNPQNPLENQLRDIGRDYERVILSDVGAFTGDTVNQIGESLEQYSVEVISVILPIAPDKISSNLNYPVKSMEQYDFAEWLEGRDIAKMDGRKTPDSVEGERPTIFYSENPVEWASIPETNTNYARKLMSDFQSDIANILGTTPEELVGETVEFRE